MYGWSHFRNCLFRALGDQMEGHGRNHFKYRFDVVTYMSDHRDDFEPFVEDDVPFDKHCKEYMYCVYFCNKVNLITL